MYYTQRCIKVSYWELVFIKTMLTETELYSVAKKTLKVDQLHFPWKTHRTENYLTFTNSIVHAKITASTYLCGKKSFHIWGFYCENWHNISTSAVMFGISTSLFKRTCNAICFSRKMYYIYLILVAPHLLLVTFCNFFLKSLRILPMGALPIWVFSTTYNSYRQFHSCRDFILHVCMSTN